MRRLVVIGSIMGCFMWNALLMASCASRDGAALDDTATQGNLLERAALEATAIVEQAQATALVLQAQAQATSVMSQASIQNPTPIPAATWMAYVPTAVNTQEVTQEAPASDPQEEPEQETGDSVQVLSVGFAGEGGFIIVRFLAPPEIAERWWQGSVSVQEEDDGTSYDEIPLMPKIGPLIGRPKQEGQIGYVMLVNTPPGLQKGALVTVVLGDYRFEHIPVE